MNGATFLFTRRIGMKRGDKVLEVGSLDVNGSIRENFLTCGEYVGIDIRPGKAVDVVCPAEDIQKLYKDGYFDMVVSSNTMEHMEHWKEGLAATWAVLRMGGRMCIVTPTEEKGRHNHPWDFWRWTKGDYKTIFKDQIILKLEDVNPRGVGILVEKVTESLNFDVEPYKVP
jgi:ubiquinone/menaquinone biosynthesis C-methylase UbiE